MSVPAELIDIDGEGIYLYENSGYEGVLLKAARLFFQDWRRWREIEAKTVYFQAPDTDRDEWKVANLGRNNWRLNLPHFFFPVFRFVYCVPREGSM